MKKTLTLGYLLSLVFPCLVIYSNFFVGYKLWPLFIILTVYPLLDLLMGADASYNDENAYASFFRNILYVHVVLHLLVMASLVYVMYYTHIGVFHWGTLTEAAVSAGLSSGIAAIVTAHELMHDPKKSNRFLAKVLLWTVSYMHLEIEHMKGHHKTVGTDEDPTSAPASMGLYSFYLMTVPGQFVDAWRIEAKKARSRFNHKAARFVVIEALTLIVLYLLFGLEGLYAFGINCAIAIITLEYVNYIRHWGLRRDKNTKIGPEHSWQSNQRFSRYVLIELTRHPDHHLISSRPYQSLQSHEDAPTLPSGYFATFFLAAIPPLWKYVMTKRLPESMRSK